ncbi:calvin cycle protein CP12-3, chloroplastic-like [Miscanthus floridulus]|uniref:calvin cycle protein CP12-3, chloroplastic-like n=1 Tax=Miscanthus floridulus TaxID=154761 RepID=UPI00345914F7
MASPSIGCPSSSTALPAGAGLRRSPSSVHPWRRRHHQQQQARRLVMAAAARRRYKGTVRREAALAELVERKVAEAMEACGERGQDDEGCRVAWDEVEEVSQARADLRRRIAEAPGDPLEHFCAHNPTADDCAVVYE